MYIYPIPLYMCVYIYSAAEKLLKNRERFRGTIERDSVTFLTFQ